MRFSGYCFVNRTTLQTGENLGVSRVIRETREVCLCEVWQTPTQTGVLTPAARGSAGVPGTRRGGTPRTRGWPTGRRPRPAGTRPRRRHSVRAAGPGTGHWPRSSTTGTGHCLVGGGHVCRDSTHFYRLLTKFSKQQRAARALTLASMFSTVMDYDSTH